MAAPVWIINQYIGRHLGFSRAADLLSLALCLPIGVVSFGVAARWLRVEEIEMALASLRASAKKRLLPARYNPQR
jgi:hypothetical protein